MTYEELLSALSIAINKLKGLCAEPTKVEVNTKYKDYGREYLAEGVEYKTVYCIPLSFEDLGSVNFIVYTDEVEE